MGNDLFACGFEYEPERTGHVDLTTAFEVFEHLPEPRAALREMLGVAPAIFFSTELVPAQTPTSVGDWWYFAPEHGQHISFYTYRALQHLAIEFGLHLYTDGFSLHLLSAKPIPRFSFRRLRLLNKLRMFSLVSRRMNSRTEGDRRLLLAMDGRSADWPTRCLRAGRLMRV